MPTLGKYCKAYPITRLRRFAGWSEKARNARSELRERDGKMVRVPRALTEDSFVYLQEDYTVTDGIYLDQNVLFEDSSEAWRTFCHEELGFQIPDYALSGSATPEESREAEAG